MSPAISLLKKKWLGSVRMPSHIRARRLPAKAVSAVVLALSLMVGAGVATTSAAPDTSSDSQLDSQRMLLESDTLIYDLDDQKVTAVGSVAIYYANHVVTADKVEVDRRAKTVTAIGNVILTDPSGNVVRSDHVQLSDDLSEGLIQQLELRTAEGAAFRASRVVRTVNDRTEFDDGVYEACVDCDGIPGKKPLWTIKARKVIHKQADKTVTLQDATFEFAGMPIAWLPRLTQPDPTVRRKTGFLIPTPVYKETLGAGITVPYFWALAPNMDFTFRPAVYSKQGFLADVEWRHRVDNGKYTVRLAGIDQASPGAFSGSSGDTDWRGAIFSTGDFKINKQWSWGWDVAVASDRAFLHDYDLPKASNDAAISDIYLTGIGDRNYFDARFYGIFVQQEDDPTTGLPQDVDLQEKQPFVHPVVDYSGILEQPVFGGQLSYDTNFTSLTREKDDIFSFNGGLNQRFRGVGGTFSRLSVDTLWKRQVTDSLGQVFTPFVGLNADAFFLNTWSSSTAGLSDDQVIGRVMPMVGLEYRFPFLVTSPSTSSVISPVAQLIARPNEMSVGDVPNEDAQSLVFDETSLFDINKFSGFDRTEGGTRLNVGFTQTTDFAWGGSLSSVIGQSFQIAGQNSYAVNNIYETGSDSGLESDASDYVAGLTLDTAQGLLFGARARFDHSSFEVARAEAQVVGLAGPLTTSLTYAFLDAQPDLGVDKRSEIQGAANLQLTRNWRMFGTARFDIINDDFVRTGIGFGYDEESFSASVAYTEDRTDSTDGTNRTIFFRLGFKTLGDVSTSADLQN
ncbi:Organic solvent tolerance protein [Hartmannibacter diazotrophicus]|uniref:LPS-assembly protein LptD n=1 Tax=Hartmannibacter diazotrophicus TaxID=1482074 RepID=A0A2C9D6L3_9HYPH|nr:LPS-assembly protein LptD [Hartmannibacter diazotrophicus]SON55962.1 Organic solvent tolerance protein [Hartmannibacter diazotrophicus]